MNIALIAAGGHGSRMNSNIPKQYMEIKGRPILYYSLRAFEKCDSVDKIILVTGQSEIEYCQKNIIDKFQFSKVVSVVAGGKERQDSVFNGLEEIKKLICEGKITDCKTVSIHDAARPLVSERIINDCIEAAIDHGASFAGVKVKDTIKIINEDGFAVNTLNRNELISVQTPQTFKFDIVYDAHIKSKNDCFYGTDDCQLVERYGGKVKLAQGEYTNIKVTTTEDIAVVEKYLADDN